MVHIKKVGRPEKENAVKSGQLSPELVRFTFIAEVELIKKIKASAKSEGLSMKDYMKNVLEGIKDKEIVKEKPVVRKKKTKNEDKLSDYLARAKLIREAKKFS